MSDVDSMIIRMEKKIGINNRRFVSYEYGEDLFGYIYLEKIRGKKEEPEKARIVDKWILEDLASLVKMLDLELYRREVEDYQNRTSK